MSEYFQLLFSDKHSFSILLYSFIFIVASLFAFNSQKFYDFGKNDKFIPKSFVMLFLILCFFYAFNDVGVDTPHYRTYFDEYKTFQDTSTHFGAVEMGYQYLNILLHYITDNSYTAIVIIRTFQLAILFGAIYLLRDRIHIGFAVMAYVALYYFQSFNLLRSSLAGSLCIFSFALFFKRKYIWAIVSAFLAFEFHKSAIFFLIALFLYSLTYGSFLKKNRKLLIILTVTALFIVLRVGADLITLFLMNDFGGGRYEDYMDNTGTSMGVFVLIQYFPVFAVLYLMRNNKNIEGVRWWNMCFVWGIIGFALAILGYTNGMLTRAAIYFSSSFIFLIPYFIRSAKGIRSYRLYWSIFLLYYMILFIITLGGLYKISGLGPYLLI